MHLSIITKAKSNAKIDDVPVINGFQAVSEDYDKQPNFHSINAPRPMHTHLQRGNIPQVIKFVCFIIRDFYCLTA